MSYTATIPVSFNHSRHAVYEALCDLRRHPDWNAGLTTISYKGRMFEGLTYITFSNVMGRVNKSKIYVVKMIPDEAIILESRSGLVRFYALYDLKEVTSDSCELVCSMRFTFSKAVFKLAESAVVTVAENRVRGDLETLRSLLAKSSA